MFTLYDKLFVRCDNNKEGRYLHMCQHHTSLRLVLVVRVGTWLSGQATVSLLFNIRRTAGQFKMVR